METAISQTAVKNTVSVALADIQPSNYNPRKNFDEKSLVELADSIRQQGVLQAIGVRPIAENRFEIGFRGAEIQGFANRRFGRNTCCHLGYFGRDSRGNGSDRKPATQRCDTH